MSLMWILNSVSHKYETKHENKKRNTSPSKCNHPTDVQVVLLSSYLSKQSRETDIVKLGSLTTWTRWARPSAARQRSRGIPLSSAPDRRDKAGERTSSGPRGLRTSHWCWGGDSIFLVTTNLWGEDVSHVCVCQYKNVQTNSFWKKISCCTSWSLTWTRTGWTFVWGTWRWGAVPWADCRGQRRRASGRSAAFDPSAGSLFPQTAPESSLWRTRAPFGNKVSGFKLLTCVCKYPSSPVLVELLSLTRPSLLWCS